MLAVGFVPSEAYTEHQAIANLLANEPVLEKTLRESDHRSTRDAIKSLAGIKRLPAAILSLAAGRGRRAARATRLPSIGPISLRCPKGSR